MHDERDLWAVLTRVLIKNKIKSIIFSCAEQEENFKCQFDVLKNRLRQNSFLEN